MDEQTVARIRKLLETHGIEEGNLECIRRLGEGAFSVADLCWYSNGNLRSLVAVKRVKAGSLIHDAAQLRMFCTEAELLCKPETRHKHIVQGIGVGASDTSSDARLLDTAFLVEEYCRGSHLRKLVVSQMACFGDLLYSRQQAIQWCMQAAQALAHLHACTPPVMHRDVKLENILLTDDSSVATAEAKLIDFGLAVVLPAVEVRDAAVATASAQHRPSRSNLERRWTRQLSRRGSGISTADLTVRSGPSLTAPPAQRSFANRDVATSKEGTNTTARSSRSMLLQLLSRPLAMALSGQAQDSSRGRAYVDASSPSNPSTPHRYHIRTSRPQQQEFQFQLDQQPDQQQQQSQQPQSQYQQQQQSQLLYQYQYQQQQPRWQDRSRSHRGPGGSSRHSPVSSRSLRVVSLDHSSPRRSPNRSTSRHGDAGDRSYHHNRDRSLPRLRLGFLSGLFGGLNTTGGHVGNGINGTNGRSGHSFTSGTSQSKGPHPGVSLGRNSLNAGTTGSAFGAGTAASTYTLLVPPGIHAPTLSISMAPGSGLDARNPLYTLQQAGYSSNSSPLRAPSRPLAAVRAATMGRLESLEEGLEVTPTTSPNQRNGPNHHQAVTQGAGSPLARHLPALLQLPAAAAATAAAGSEAAPAQVDPWEGRQRGSFAARRLSTLPESLAASKDLAATAVAVDVEVAATAVAAAADTGAKGTAVPSVTAPASALTAAAAAGVEAGVSAAAAAAGIRDAEPMDPERHTASAATADAAATAATAVPLPAPSLLHNPTPLALTPAKDLAPGKPRFFKSPHADAKSEPLPSPFAAVGQFLLGGFFGGAGSPGETVHERASDGRGSGGAARAEAAAAAAAGLLSFDTTRSSRSNREVALLGMLDSIKISAAPSMNASRRQGDADEQQYDLTKRTGSLMYMAPEVFKGLPYNCKADVFSLAICCYELLHQRSILLTVLGSTRPGTDRHQAVLEYAAAVAAGYRPPLADSLPKAMKELLQQMWSGNPLERPSMASVAARLQALAGLQEWGVLDQRAAAAAAACGCCTVS